MNEERYEDMYIPMPVTLDGVEVDAYNNFGELTVRDGVSITTSCEDPEAAFMFLEALQDEEIQKLMFWGIEDEDYLVDDDGRMYRTEEIKEKLKDSDYLRDKGLGSDWWYIYPHGYGNYSDGINYWTPGEDPLLVYEGYADEQKEILDQYGLETFAQFCHTCEPTDYGLLWSVTPDAGSDEATILANFQELAYKYIPMMIMAESDDDFDSIFEEYCEATENAGIAQYQDFFDETIQSIIAVRNQ